MVRYAIDAKALLHIAETGLQVHRDHQLVAPNAVRSDALQLLLDDVRRGERSERDALDLHTRLTELKLRTLGDRVSRRTAWDLAREHGWTVREAEYVAVARLQADAFVAVDTDVRARAKGLVPLAEPALLLAPEGA